MKNALLLGCICLLSTHLVAQSPAMTPTEEAIKKACMAETQAWLDNDMEAWAATRLQSGQDLQVWTNPDGSVGQLSTWKTIGDTIREWAKSSKKSAAKLVDENFRFTIHGDMAFVSFDQTMIQPDGTVSKSHDQRLMILTGSGWKIQAAMAFYQADAPLKK